MIPISPDYNLARRMIARLKEDPDLTHLVYDDPWDTTDQAGKIIRAGAKFRGSVAVSPAGMINVRSSDPGQHVRQLQATLAVTLLATTNTTRKSSEHPTTASWLAGLTYAVLDNVINWSPVGSSIPYTKPVVASIEDYDMSKIPDLKNCLARIIILTAPVTIAPRL